MLSKLFNKAKTDHKVIVFTDREHLRILPVYSDHDGMLETAVGMFPKAEATTFYDEMDGGLCYVFNMSHEAYVEAERLKHLERQVVLSRIFQFDTKSGFTNFKELLPWIAVFLLILFK